MLRFVLSNSRPPEVVEFIAWDSTPQVIKMSDESAITIGRLMLSSAPTRGVVPSSFAIDSKGHTAHSLAAYTTMAFRLGNENIVASSFSLYAAATPSEECL